MARPDVLGVPLTIDGSCLIGLVLVTWTFTATMLPPDALSRRPVSCLAAGVLAALLLLGSLVLHEAGHWVVARRAGLPVVGLTLSLAGGTLALGAAPRSPGVEARVALAGPIASLLTALAAAVAHVAMVEAGADPVVATVAALVAAGNLVIALVNLLPGPPLDGGRVVRAAMWWVSGDGATADRITGRLGRLLAWALLALAVVASASGHAVAAAWVAVLGMIVWSGRCDA
jgi:Zn-dependent protease